MAWYLGHTFVSEELIDLINTNRHTLLIESYMREEMKSNTDFRIIHDKYKTGKDYYEFYKQIEEDYLFPTTTSSIRIDKNLEDSLRKLFSAEISPGLAHANKLVGLPKALFINCET